MKNIVRSVGLAIVCAVCLAAQGANSAQTDNAGRQAFIDTLNARAQAQLDERAEAVKKIKTRADAEQRKAEVRRKILELLGGLPEHPENVSVQRFGSITGDGFRIEKLAYESLPGLWVTANLYRPADGDGPFPAVVLAPGHEPMGKSSQYGWGVNLARNGIVGLAIDPLGQSERLQYVDPETNTSPVGSATEHAQVNVAAMLIGENVARYFVNDTMRGIDYLSSRTDVDTGRIGAVGCSGGGIPVAYTAALDDRLKAVAVGCYITSFGELLPSAAGAQDAEQSLPHFIEQGLDFADWVEAFAPKPYVIVSTTDDMFPFKGARKTYEEAKRFYGLYGAEDHLQWFTGPGGHGAIFPMMPKMLGFFLQHLKGAPAGEVAFARVRPEGPEDLQVTSTGQVATSIGGETVPSLIRAHAGNLHPTRAPSQDEIRALTATEAIPGAAPPKVRTSKPEQRDGYRIESLALASGGVDIAGLLAYPPGDGRKPAVLLLGAPADVMPDLDRLARSGRVVMALEPRPSPPGKDHQTSKYLGYYSALILRALLTGNTIVGLRTDDAIRAVDWLAARTEVDPGSITIYGRGTLGMVALHAAALDARIGGVIAEDTLASYRLVLEQPLHQNMSEVVIPSVLLHYDVGGLMLAIAPRPVVVVNPRDATGASLDDEVFRARLRYVFDSESARVRLRHRTPGAPLPLD